VGIFGCGGTNLGFSPMTEKNFFETLKKAYQSIKEKTKK